MAANGKINGHRPERLMRRLMPAVGVGIADLPPPFERAVDAVTEIRTSIAPDARSATLLGTERRGSAVMLDQDGLALTIGYLLLESHSIELADRDGGWIKADFVGYDFETGFGLVRAVMPMGMHVAALGDAALIGEGNQLIVAGPGGKDLAMPTTVVSLRPFAGYWEYYLERAIFTAPAYPEWSGVALIGGDGGVVGIGSLLVEVAGGAGPTGHGNMFVPTDLLKPVLGDLVAHGRVARRSRPWLGLFTADANDALVVMHVVAGGPAEKAGIAVGDVIVSVAGTAVDDLAEFYHGYWQLGAAGVDVPLTILRHGKRRDIRVRSADRYDFYRTPRP